MTVVAIRGVARYIHGVMFGRSNLLVTNCLISSAMGALGDVIQQYYDILKIKNESHSESESSLDTVRTQQSGLRYVRTLHMTCAGFTTGLVSHFWYIYLDKWLGSRRTLFMTINKVLLDQIIFSPISLTVYFSTLSIAERSGLKRFKEELIEKGLCDIYLVEWFIWPPAQFINFYLLPLRYRILFDNVISFGFDIYCPYVKYKTQLKSEKMESMKNRDKDSGNQDNSNTSSDQELVS
jgi:protein Mpv17